MSWFSAGNLFGSLGFHDTPKAPPAAPAPAAPAGPDPFALLLEQSKAASAAALKAQTDANLIAQQASQPTQDSEGARSASDDQRRKLMQGSNFGIGMQALLGAPPVGFRMLSGQ